MTSGDQVEGFNANPHPVISNESAETSAVQMSTEEKWMVIANAVNRILFLLFSCALVTLLAIILPLWTRGSK